MFGANVAGIGAWLDGPVGNDGGDGVLRAEEIISLSEGLKNVDAPVNHREMFSLADCPRVFIFSTRL